MNMARKKMENNREKYTTLIDANLLKKAKIKAIEEGYEGANSIIEKALEMYLSKEKGTIWMKKLESGWVDITAVFDEKIINISVQPELYRERKNADKARYSEEDMRFKAYNKVGYILK
jgi:hypothetical protein